jgi:hypothetical protein
VRIVTLEVFAEPRRDVSRSGSGTLRRMVPVPPMVPVRSAPRIVRRGPLLALAALAAALVAATGKMATSGSTTDVADNVLRALPWALLAVICIPALLAIAQRPQRGLLLLIALVPFNGLLLIVPGRPPFVEGWKEALAIYTLVWAAFGSFGALGRSRVDRPRPGFLAPIALYIFVGLASAIAVAITASPVQAAVGLKVGYFWLFAALAAWLAPLNARDRDGMVSILMASGVVTSLWGIAQQGLGHERLVSLGYEYNTNVRFTGEFLRSISTFPTPFNFAFFLTLVILVCLPIALDDTRRFRNQVFLAALPIVGLALGFTFVRGAWLALMLGLMVLAVRRYRVLLFPVPFALLSLAFLPGTFGASAFQSESFDERTLGWSQNLTKLLDAPFGRGIGTTGAAAEKVLAVEGGIDFGVFYQPDNQYFKALYEIGVPGFFFYGMVLIAIVVTLFRVEPLLFGSDRAFAMGLSANVVGAMGASLVATWLEIFPNELYLWLLVTIAYAAAYPESS